MSPEDILSQVREIIGDVLDQPDVQVNLDSTAADVDGWDSFAHINIVVAVEARFGIKINTAEIEEIHNVGELVELVHRKLKARGA
ncbi:MAG: acyl carrier protein [Gammaproteobacteria bacterium]